MAAPGKIVVVGSLNTDMIVRTARVPIAGETLTSQSFQIGCGGKGANQATAIARLSRKRDDVKDQTVSVGMAGAVGDDEFGKEAIKNLKANGIDTSQIVVKGGVPTGTAIVIIDDESRDNRIILSRGANGSVKPDDFFLWKDELPDMAVFQLEIPVSAVIQMIEAASTRNVEVLLNPAPALKLPVEVYKAVTYLVVNESEAAIVTGNEGKAIDWLKDSPEQRALLDLGAEHILVTLGSEGGLYLKRSGEKTESYRWHSMKVNVRDTAAAGDTFVGAFSVAMASTKDRSSEAFVKAIQWANEAASITVQRDGAADAIPWRDELRALE